MADLPQLLKFSIFLLTLSVGYSTICFEGTQRSFTVSELEGQFCINITRVANESDPLSVGYQTLATMGTGFASPNFDYIPVPAGGSGFERLIFQDDSESEEICITILNDTRGCEGPETFRIIFDVNPAASNPCGDEVNITITDTPVNILFETRIMTQENAERVSFAMSRQAGITHLKEITIRLAENGSDPKCVVNRRRPYTFEYRCNDPECTDTSGPDIGGSDLKIDQLELLPDNMIFDGRRECTLVATQTTDCLISFPQGNVVTVVVEDDDAILVGFTSDFEDIEENEMLTLTAQSSVPVPLEYSVFVLLKEVKDMPAKANMDFVDEVLELTFLANETMATAAVGIINDNVFEDLEQFEATFNKTFHTGVYTIAFNSRMDVVLIQIFDEDEVTVAFPEDLSVIEGKSQLSKELSVQGEYEVQFCVQIESKMNTDIIDALTVATGGVDFEEKKERVCFQPNSGGVSESFNIRIVNDDIPELNETFSLQLLSDVENMEGEITFDSRVNFVSTNADALIIDDDAPYKVFFSQSEYRVEEFSGALDVEIEVDKDHIGTNITVMIEVVSKEGSMYASVNGKKRDVFLLKNTFVIPENVRKINATINTVPDDEAELDEKFEVILSVTNETMFTEVDQNRNQTEVTIIDDDELVIEAVFERTIVEGEQSFLEISMNILSDFSVPFSLRIHLMNDSALEYEDFQIGNTIVDVSLGTNETTFQIEILNDDIPEKCNESFIFSVLESGSSGLMFDLTEAQGTISIRDNEVVHTVNDLMYMTPEDIRSGKVDIYVSRSDCIARNSTVFLAPMSNSAVGPGDFPDETIKVSFPQNVFNMSVSVPISDDMISELEETFFVVLIQAEAGPSGLVEDLIGTPNATEIIIQDDDVLMVGFSEPIFSVSENNGSVIVTVVTDKDFSFDFTINVTVSPGTAEVTDIALGENIITFIPGMKEGSVEVLLVDDKIAEQTEFANLELSIVGDPPRDIGLRISKSTIRILDNEILEVNFEKEQYAVTEGQSINITIEANVEASMPYSVSVTPEDNDDFQLDTASVQFLPGDKSKSFIFTAKEDDIKELLETVTLVLIPPTPDNFTVTKGNRSSTAVTIEDATEVFVEFEKNLYEVEEDETINITLTASNRSDQSYTINITMNGEEDISLSTTTVTFGPGSLSQTVSLTAALDDLVEPLEEFILNLILDSESIDFGIKLGSQSSTLIQVMDTTEAILVNFDRSSYIVSEGDTISITLFASGNFSIPFNVSLETSQSPDDYKIMGSPILFTPGKTSFSFMLEALADNIKETDETYSLSLLLNNSAGGLNVALGNQSSASLRIEDPTVLQVMFEDAMYIVPEGDTRTILIKASVQYVDSFNVSLIHNASADLLVANTVTFEPLMETVSVDLTALADDVKEPTEEFNLRLSLSPTAGSLGLELGDPSLTTIIIPGTNESITVFFKPSKYSVLEGDIAEVFLESTQAASEAYTIRVTQLDGESDFAILNGSEAAFSAGSTSASIFIKAFEDDIKERIETYFLNIELTPSASSLGVVTVNISATLAIDDNTDDILVSFERPTYTVVEGESIEVKLIADKNSSESFKVEVIASQLGDVDLTPEIVNFSIFTTEAVVKLTAIDDGVLEPSETVTLSLNILTDLGVKIGIPDLANVTILEAFTGLSVEFEESVYSVVENNCITINIITSSSFAVPFSVNIIETSVSMDYFLQGVPVTMSPDGSSNNFTFCARQDDIKEVNEMFILELEVVDDGGLNISLGGIMSTEVTVVDVSVVTVNFNETDYSVSEGGTIVVHVVADGPSAEDYDVSIVLTPGSAGSDDYDEGSHIASFVAGSMLATVAIGTTDSDCVEPLESFELSLEETTSSELLDIAIGTPSNASATITDESELTVHFEVTSKNITEGESMSVDVVADDCYKGTFSLGITAIEGKATSDDYTIVSSITFNGADRQSLTISTTDDNMVEEMEDFSVELSIDDDGGLNLQLGASLNVAIIDNDERITVSFARDLYTVVEGFDAVITFSLSGDTSQSFFVLVETQNGTAFGGIDFNDTFLQVDPRVESVVISTTMDDILEDEECFEVTLTIPMNLSFVGPGPITETTVCIQDITVMRANDTIMADPVYTVPLKVVPGGNTEEFSAGISLCYEIHGSPNTWFNVISDTCTSVNTLYTEALLMNHTGHVITHVAILTEDSTGVCTQLEVTLKNNTCLAEFNGESVVNKRTENGIVLMRTRRGFRISLPNCANENVVLWITCERQFESYAMKVTVSRGLNLNPTSHGFIGQFWNVDVTLDKFNETFDRILQERDGSVPHYIVTLLPPPPSTERSFIAELYNMEWDGTRRNCLYAGSNQAGSASGKIQPLGTVIEGNFRDYKVSEAFASDFEFSQFDSDSCK